MTDDPREIFEQIVHRAVQECAPVTDIAVIAEVTKREIAKLPPELQAQMGGMIEELASYVGPGFHEHGPH